MLLVSAHKDWQCLGAQYTDVIYIMKKSENQQTQFAPKLFVGMK